MGFELEQQYWQQGLSTVLGIDEAGRGAWAGPLTVAGVIFAPCIEVLPFRDSKTLSAKQREKLAREVKSRAVAWHVVFVPALQVDNEGVLNATLSAAVQIIAFLQPRAVITDYLKVNTSLPLMCPAKADSLSYSVAAASILAKVARDEYMQDLAQHYPEYAFAQHKGYGTEQHRMALKSYGLTPEHRKSFKPVANILGQPELFKP